MKPVGALLKEARRARSYSLENVEQETRIKKEFIRAIENGEWGKLPEYPVVVGFVKNYANFVGIDSRQAVAFLRRDYPPQKLAINPKPDAVREFHWGPRLTFAALIMVVILAIGGYLGYQYYSFRRPPKLTVNTPAENEVLLTPTTVVSGETEVGATVRVNTQPAVVNEKGVFTAEIEVTPKTEEITVRAVSRAGKETIITRHVQIEIE